MTATKIYLDSYGCQMNLYDSELVSSLLGDDGFIMSPDEKSADVILINTCAVRGHAEQRAIGRMRTLTAQKKSRRGLIVGALGCMAESQKETLLNQVPGLDFAVGPDGYRQLPNLIYEQLGHRGGIFRYVHGLPKEVYSDVPPVRREGVNAWVAIMRGCNNFCSYCIVPYVRGRERSRAPEEIITEVVEAVRQGFPEVTLLGQNVNSYAWSGLDFPDLLGKITEVDGLKRLRFLTSHPKDLSDKLIQRIAAGGVLCPSLHLPAQSGSDRILKEMNRGYTAQDYLNIVLKLREAVPDLSLTTDLLCGFPGETEEDFNQTLDLIRAVKFDDAFTFKYSERPGTTAAKLSDDVPEETKVERLERMIDLCRQMSDQARQKLIGKQVEVLLENPSPRDKNEWSGRTRCDRMALVPGNFKRGSIVEMIVEAVRGFSLWGPQI